MTTTSTYRFKNYRYGYQGSEKDNEIKGNGNSYTTHFRQLDPRLGRWLTIDPKAKSTPWESPYVSMGNNPIWHNDVLGDKWGKPDDKKQQESDKSHADKLKKVFHQTELAFKEKFESIQSEIDKFTGDKSSEEFQQLQKNSRAAYIGMIDMQNAQQELTELGEDENYYTFDMVYIPNGGELHPKIEKNEEGTFTYTIPYANGYASTGTKAHETKHAYQFMQALAGGNAYSKYTENQLLIEREAYIRQYHAAPESLKFPVKSIREINLDYLKQFKTSDGTPVYQRLGQ